jgi:ubiquinone/menaquinone biosynthesis C-methylase UbiE
MSQDDRRFDHNKMHMLISEDRKARWEPARFLTKLAIQPGASVLDLGSGPGFWSIPLAEIVGADGTVWALDVSQEMLDLLAQRNPPKQVRLLKAELPKIKLPDSSLDWVWAAFILHEVTPPETLAGELFRLLKKNGTVAVLDWRPDALTESGPPRHHRLSVAQVSKYLLTAGFKAVQQTWQDDDAYLLEARKT